MSASLQCAAGRKGTCSTRKDKGNEVRAATAASFLLFLAKAHKSQVHLAACSYCHHLFPRLSEGVAGGREHI